MIKVLHISKYYPPYIGGLESFCHDIVTALKDSNEYKQMVLCFNDKPETIYEEYENVEVRRVGIQKIIASQPLAKDYRKELQKAISDFSPDIIHFFYPNPFGAHYLLKSNFKGVIHLDWICDIVKQKFIKQFFKRQSDLLLKRANYVTSITPTYFEGTDYLPKYQGEKDYIACRIGDSRLKVREEERIEAIRIKEKYPGKKLVFFFGRHTKYKGLRYLIQANNYIDPSRVQIIIGGTGEQTTKLQSMAKRFCNVEFVGRLKDDEINSYLLACDVFAFPSITRNEAFGISLAEAMFFGKPTVTFTIPGSGVNWVSPNNISGLEAKNRDVKEFAFNIMRIVNDHNLYEKLSKGAKNRCLELFTRDSFDLKVKSVYKEIRRINKL